MKYRWELRAFTDREAMERDIKRSLGDLDGYNYKTSVGVSGDSKILWLCDNDITGYRLTQQIMGMEFTSAFVDLSFDKSVIEYVTSRIRSAHFPIEHVKVFHREIRA